MRQPSRSRKTRHATGAAQAKDRQSLHGGRQIETIGEYGIKARHGKAGRRDSDNRFNLAERNTGPVGALSRHVFEKLNGGRLKYIGS